MKKYTILHTIETAGPGGAETILLSLASHLDPSRFRSVVLLPRVDWLFRELRQAAVPVRVVKSERWYDFALPRAIAELAAKEKVDLIHSHLPDQNFYSCVAGRMAGRRVVVTYHGTQQISGTAGIKSRLKLGFVKRTAVAAVAVSDHIGTMLQAAGFCKNRTVRIYNGIASDRFEAALPGGFRAELGCSNGSKLVGMVANLRDSKGYAHFVRAARVVADRMPKARFLAVGQIDDRRHRDLLALVRELGLEESFHFLGFRPDVPQILANLDVFVLSSVSEGFSLATIEAMAAGKPVVVTRSGGPEEIVEDGQTGFLVPPADAPALGARICEILGSADLASALSQRAQAVVRARFSLRAMVGQYQNLYERCLSTA